MRSSFTCLAVVALTCFAFPTHHADAQVVDLTFSGTYDTGGQSIFGQSGSSVPYTYTMSYDTSLDTNSFEFATGVPIVGVLETTHDWFGYSASGITTSSISFGTKTFTPSMISTPDITAGLSADFWMDVDISTGATPSLLYMTLDDNVAFDGFLQFGFIQSNVTNYWLGSRSRIFDFFGGNSEDFGMSYSAAIPEPGGIALLALGALATTARRRRRI